MDRYRHYLSRDQFDYAPIERCIRRRDRVRRERSADRFRQRKAISRARQISIPALGIITDWRAAVERRRGQRSRSRRRWSFVLLRNRTKGYPGPRKRRTFT